MTQNFAITHVHLIENPNWSESIYKILHPGSVYRLNYFDTDDNKITDNFYDENIVVSAIVGKNGCGKSTLLDIIFRLINNLGHCIIEAMANYKPKQWERFHRLDYCFNFYADLHYVCNGNKGMLRVRDDIVALEYGEQKMAFRKVPKESTPLLYQKGIQL